MYSTQKVNFETLTKGREVNIETKVSCLFQQGNQLLLLLKLIER